MLSSGLRKVMKALLILLAAAWITTDAKATSKGERAPGLADKRFVSTYLDAAVRLATDDAFALVLPEVNANTMASCCSIKPDGGEKAFAMPVGGAIHRILGVHISLLHKLSRTHGCSRMNTL